jgi:hypothetical protein
MDDSFIARMGYDPVRIFAHIHGHRPTGIARLGSAPAEPPPLELKAEEEGPPRPGKVAAAPTADEEGSPAGLVRGEDPVDNAAHGPPDGEEPLPAPSQPRSIVAEWLHQHWDTVYALARAGEAPLRPPPLPPEETEALEEVGGVEPLPPPYVEPDDRWTKWKMARFLRELAATHSVTVAARKVGMSRQSAYKLRSRLKGQPFDVAWEAAFRHGYDNLAHAALELALEGEEVPHYYHGELVATHRQRNPQLIVQLLKMRNRAGAPMLGRYGAAAEFWSEDWERMLQRIETASVTWRDEHAALDPAELAALDLPDERERIDRIIARNRPDEGLKKDSAR